MTIFGKGRKAPGTMNKTEARYADILKAREIAGEILWWKYECIKFKLADKCWFNVDFLVLTADGTLECHEVKGGFIMDDAAVKLKTAAAMYPLRFLKCVYKNKATGWTITEMSA
jgi:hypothetical protein